MRKNNEEIIKQEIHIFKEVLSTNNAVVNNHVQPCKTMLNKILTIRVSMYR